MKRTSVSVAICLTALGMALPGHAEPGATAALECAQVTAPVPAAPGLMASFRPDRGSAHTPPRTTPNTDCRFGYNHFKPFIAKCPELLPAPQALGPSGKCTVKGATVRARPAAGGGSGSDLKIRKKVKNGYRSIEAYISTFVPTP